MVNNEDLEFINNIKSGTYIDEKIGVLRDKIDRLDFEMAKLLNNRFEIVKQIGHLKIQNNSTIYRPDREKNIIDNLVEYAKQHNLSNLNRERLESIFHEIFGVALNIEMPQRVSFLGPIGSFCHQAAESIFGPLSHYLNVNTITAVFQSLKNHNAKYGVIPLENNTNGMVGESIDNLARCNFSIIGEIVFDIHHSFATMAQDIGEIERIYSRDIAFGQCQEFINDYNLSNVEQVGVTSTAYAAKLASKDSKSAAICSHIAAKIYGLPIMFNKIQTSFNNQTRFVIISDFFNPQAKNQKTSIFVSIKDFEKSGSLFELLRDFKEENINITKIDSRPIHYDRGFRSGFYMDFYGHRYDENIARIFAKRGDEIKWLGSYPTSTTKESK